MNQEKSKARTEASASNPLQILTICITLSGGTEDEQHQCAYDIRMHGRAVAKRRGVTYADTLEAENAFQ